ncbi:unnamed protein product, partial [marine sediment metagenome]
KEEFGSSGRERGRKNGEFWEATLREGNSQRKLPLAIRKIAAFGQL